MRKAIPIGVNSYQKLREEDYYTVDKSRMIADVFIGISFPRYSKRTVKAIDYAKERGATVIAITDSAGSPLAAKCDHLLLARSDMASFVDSLVAPLSLINALIVAVGMRRQKEVGETYAQLEKIWDEYDVYEKNEENIV